MDALERSSHARAQVSCAPAADDDRRTADSSVRSFVRARPTALLLTLASVSSARIVSRLERASASASRSAGIIASSRLACASSPLRSVSRCSTSLALIPPAALPATVIAVAAPGEPTTASALRALLGDPPGVSPSAVVIMEAAALSASALVECLASACASSERYLAVTHTHVYAGCPLGDAVFTLGRRSKTARLGLRYMSRCWTIAATISSCRRRAARICSSSSSAVLSAARSSATSLTVEGQ